MRGIFLQSRLAGDVKGQRQKPFLFVMTPYLNAGDPLMQGRNLGLGLKRSPAGFKAQV